MNGTDERLSNALSDRQPTIHAHTIIKPSDLSGFNVWTRSCLRKGNVPSGAVFQRLSIDGTGTDHTTSENPPGLSDDHMSYIFTEAKHGTCRMI
jgi:hypothetical protein